MNAHNVIYLNALGKGELRTREKILFNHLENNGVSVTHSHINWHSGEQFESVFDRVTVLAEEKLRTAGRLTLVGVSAGGSMALNVFGRIQHPELQAVNICGAVREEHGNLAPWDYRTLKFRAYRHGRQLDSLYDSVKYCEQKTVPSFSQNELERIRVIKPLVDFVVPKVTMGIPDVDTRTVPAIGHNMGIFVGLWQLPQALASQTKQQL